MPLVCRAHRFWTVKCPPCKKHMVGGTLVPTVRGTFGFKKTKRVTVEVYGNEEDDTPTDGVSSRRFSKQDANASLADELREDDRVVVRILKPRKHWGLSRDHDDSSDEEDEDGETTLACEDGWVEYRKYDLDAIDQIELDKNSFEAHFGVGNHVEVRELCFGSKAEVDDFNEELTKLREVEKERAKMKLEAYRASVKAETDEKEKTSDEANVKTRDLALGDEDATKEDVKLLVEIVSAMDLPAYDGKSSDPYVVVYHGRDEVHRTKRQNKNLNPVWTVDNGSLFILNVSATDFFSSSTGLTFLVKDYDGLSSNDVIGKVSISQEDLLQSKGERKEYELATTKKSSTPLKPLLNVRVRPAVESDFKFIQTLHSIQKSKKEGVYTDTAFVGPKPHSVTMLKRETKSGPPVLYRVKPGPDPSRDVYDTKWLSEEQINEESMSPSANWVECGSGNLGRLFVEVISCDNLPNMDTSAMGGKTDAFACLIYEDAIVSTDVINDTNSPRWMPWSQRAFAFHVMHPSSQILIGVFDYDGEGMLDAHDPIGRVSINVTNFRADTDYILNYDLFESTLDDDRKSVGKIKVRVRLEWKEYRNVLKACLSPPPACYVNTPRDGAFKSAYFVVHGEENLQVLDTKAIKSYRTELESYLGIIPSIKEAVMTVLLWRGHYELNIGAKIKLPLHSILCFFLSTFVVENLNYIPAFSLFCIAWLLLATNEERQRNPSPWKHSLTFSEMWYAVLANSSPSIEIADNENEAAIRRYEEAKAAEAKAQVDKTLEMKKQNEELGNYMADEAAESLEDSTAYQATSVGGGGLQINPLKPILLPIQRILGQVCIGLRIVSSIVSWDESQYAFIITNACIVGGLILMFIPWSFFLRWIARILVWILTGPWMKLVDIYVLPRLEEKDSGMSKVKALMDQKAATIINTKQQAMITKEQYMKYFAMKRYMFGKYVVRVPQFKEYRYSDVPHAESYAKPHSPDAPKENIVAVKHGQKLVGDMIMEWNDAGDDFEKVEKEEEAGVGTE